MLDSCEATCVAVAGLDGPRCIVQLGQPQYSYGEVVTASRIEITNTGSHALSVELKMWLRLPDGRVISATNVGADGAVVIPGNSARNFGPFDVMGVGSEISPGLWEFGCRLIDPTTGRQLDEDSDLFEIR